MAGRRSNPAPRRRRRGRASSTGWTPSGWLSFVFYPCKPDRRRNQQYRPSRVLLASSTYPRTPSLPGRHAQAPGRADRWQFIQGLESDSGALNPGRFLSSFSSPKTEPGGSTRTISSENQGVFCKGMQRYILSKILSNADYLYIYTNLREN